MFCPTCMSAFCLSAACMVGFSRAPVGYEDDNAGRRYVAGLAVGALGVVYGDIGTSPLYALWECFQGTRAIAATPDNIRGALSLIFWSLVLLVSVKYLTFVTRADNKGEGGILALLSLACPERRVGAEVFGPRSTRSMLCAFWPRLAGWALGCWARYFSC